MQRRPPWPLCKRQSTPGLRMRRGPRLTSRTCRRRDRSMTDDPTILKFPAPIEPTRALGPDEPDLQAILAAWNEATDRLQHTHEALSAEVRRLSDELEAKNR